MARVASENEQHRRLVEFLLAAVEPQQLWNFLRGHTGAEQLIHELPAPSIPPADFFAAAADKLIKQGFVRERAFWMALRAAFRRKERAIREIAALFDVLLDPPRRPILEPTLSQWVRMHWRLLAGLVLVPAGLAGLVCWDQLTEQGPPISVQQVTRITLMTWQATFSALAVCVFLVWPRPGTSPLLARSDSEKHLAEQIRDRRGLDDAGWRAAMGLSPGERSPHRPWRRAAERARDQMRHAWIWLFVAWSLLSVALLMFEMVLKPLDSHTLIAARSVVVRLLNDLASVTLVACYWIMTFRTVRLRETADPGEPPRFVAVASVGSVLVVIVAVVHALALIDPANAARQMRIDFAFGLLSATGSAVATALLVGRLDSALIGVRWWLLALLYVYAIVQPCFTLTRLLSDASGWGDASPELQALWTGSSMHDLFRKVQFGVHLYALFAKYILFAVFAWIYHTGRLDFYLLRMRRLRGQLGEDWMRLTTSSPPDAPTASLEKSID
jgi:hypothetical protein